MKKQFNIFNDSDNSNRDWLGYLGLGVQLAATVTVMAFLGVWLDGKFDTRPLLTVIFSFLGVASGLYSFIRSVIKSDK